MIRARTHTRTHTHTHTHTHILKRQERGQISAQHAHTICTHAHPLCTYVAYVDIECGVWNVGCIYPFTDVHIEWDESLGTYVYVISMRRAGICAHTVGMRV